MGQIPAADTIFDHPLYTSWPTNAQSGDTPIGGRLMSSSPHTDGMVMVSAWDCAPSSTNLVLTRNAEYDWSLNRTAAAAESYYVRVNAGEFAFQRLGEQYILSLFPDLGNKTSSPQAPPKGLMITDIFAVLNVGVVALTSATLRLSKVAYPLEGAASAAPVGTDIIAPTALGNLGVNTAGQYLTQYVAVPAASQQFNTADISQTEIELAFTLANTGTIRVAGLGFHFNFNFN